MNKPRGNPKVPAKKTAKVMNDGKKEVVIQLSSSEIGNSFAVLGDQEKYQETLKV